jgi:cell division transport system permease protein
VRAKLFVGEAVRSIGANLSTTVAATMTVLIGMFLLGLFIALGSWVLSWTNRVEEGVVVKVFFEQDASPQQLNAVRLTLTEMDDLIPPNGIKFVSKEDALELMRQRTPALVENLTSNPFPPSYEVRPTRAEDADDIVNRLAPLPAGVSKINDGGETTDRVVQVAKIIGAIFLLGSIILLIASTMLISNTIRLSIFSRRREIEVMKLVGASNWFVRGPFMLEGLLCGLAGALLAVLLLLLAKEIALPAILPRLEASEGVSALSFPIMALILLGVSLLVGAAGSGITLRRFLRIEAYLYSARGS